MMMMANSEQRRQPVQQLRAVITLLLLLKVAEGQITSGPSNEAALVGTQATMNCTTTGLSSGNILLWNMQPMSPAGTIGDTVTVYNTNSGVTSGLENTYAIETNTTGQYNLIVKSVALALGGKYSCNLLGSTVYYGGELVAVAQIQCPTSGTTILPGEQVVAACSVQFQGYMAPILTWTDGTGHQLSSVYNTTNTMTTAYTNFTANSTHDGMVLNCTLAFAGNYIYDTHAANNLPTYTESCSTYYYVTHGVSVMVFQPPVNSQGVITSPLAPGQIINCTSNGRPTPTYTWTNAQGNGPMVAGQELIITNAMGAMQQPVTYICTASNVANGQSYNMSTSVTFTVQNASTAAVQSSSVEPWVIAVAVVVPIVVIVAAAVVGFILFKRHKANQPPQKSGPPPSSAPLMSPIVTSYATDNLDNRATSPPPPTAAPRSTGPSPYAPAPGRSFDNGHTSPASGFADIGGSTNRLDVGSAPRQTGSAASTPQVRHAPTVNMNPDPRATPRYNNTPVGQQPPRPASAASSVASGASSTSSRGESNSTRTASNQFLPMAAGPGSGAISPPPFAGGPQSYAGSVGGSRPGSRPNSAFSGGHPPMPLSAPPPPPPHRSVSSMSGSSVNGSVHGSFV